MRYLNSNSLNLLKTIESNGVYFSGTVTYCDVCAVGKSHQLAHPKTANNKVQPTCQLVMADLMGPVMPEALGSFQYVCKISNEYTTWTEIYLLKSKGGAFHAFQSFIQSMVIPGGVRSDIGGWFIGNDFRTYCRHTGIWVEFASTDTPQQIGLSERLERTLTAMIRCMLADSGLTTFLQRKLMSTAAYLANRSPHSALDMQSPHEMLKRTEPDPQHLRVVGARTFVHIVRHTPKLALTAVEGRLAGYSNDSKSYRVYNPATRRIMEIRNVVFIE
ncbi:unnamed protein product, partial [Sphacelaria rigidula]